MTELTVEEALRLILDQVDYIAGNCDPTEMVAAVLPTDVIETCRTALKARQQQEKVND